ncbi:MAG: hypothetical protein ABIB41_06960 [Nitrospirota bacterium]
MANNPVNWIDPLGLTWEDVERAMEVLKKYHPEYYNPRASVSFGDTGKDVGDWDPGTENIVLSVEHFGGTLSDDQKYFLLETLAHEYWHSNHPWQTLRDYLVDPEHVHVDIEIQKRLSKEAYDAMKNKRQCK